MKYKILFIVLIFPFLTIAQDVKFTQIHGLPQNLNPALTGTQGNYQISYAYRNQWPELSGSFITNYLEYSQPIDVLHGGIGINLLRDVAGGGVLKSNSIGLAYAYQTEITRKFNLSFGINTQLSQQRVNLNLLTTSPNPTIPSDYNYNITSDGYSQLKGDLNSGILLYSKRFFIGASADHLLKINHGTPMLYKIHSGYRINPFKSEKLAFTPSMNLFMQSGFYSLSGNLTIQYGNMFLGTNYDFNSAISFMAGYTNSIFRLSYMYGRNFSKLTNFGGSNHEIVLQLKLNKKDNCGTCPNFDGEKRTFDHVLF